MSTIPLVEEPSAPTALVLCDGDLSSDDRDVAALLDFFGIAWGVAPINQIEAHGPSCDALDRSKFRILTSASVLAKALFEERPALLGLLSRAGSVYVHAFPEADSGKNLVKLLTGDKDANIRPLCSRPTTMSVTSDLPEICGAMSGLAVPVMPTETDQAFDLHGQRDLHHIISTPDGDAFVRVLFQGVPFYLNAGRKTIEIHSPAREFFDVKKFFACAVPITMYLRWAFAGVCWKGSETTACLIVDDPLLRPQHGFLDFRRVLELMDEHNFTISLAFIPWNWRRTHPDVVKLFRQRSDRFSVSIHGCDHIAGEFATRSLAELNARTKIASQRMESLNKRTSLQHDRIMIFPQGAFSAEIGRVLKLNGFVAAVNTEVSPSADSPNETEIADLWQVAITKYGTFPLFTRRYCLHGIENFAFDALLGKPSLIVAHHDEFKADGRNLIECIDRLNSLQGKLIWRSLGDAVSRSFRVRTEPDGKRMLQIYGHHALIENPSDEPHTIEIMKEENDPDLLRAVIVNQQPVAWSVQGKFLRLNVTIPSRGRADLRTLYIDSLGQGFYPNDITYRLKTGLRRYLCEARDNYVAKNEFLSSRLAARN